MSYEPQILRFPSADGIHELYAEIHEPTVSPKGVIQLSHGMTDHVGRYTALADFLVKNGFVFAGHCHLGHGKSASSPDELGFFAEKNGADLVVEDVGRMNALIRERYGDLPIFLLGHSMGSFIARIYAKEHPETLDGLIIHGTGGPSAVVNFGKALVSVMSLFLGKRHRSPFMKKLASLGYNSKFPKEEGGAAWLTRDNKIARAKSEDEYANFVFTLSAYKDLFRFVSRSNSGAWFKGYPKNLPTLIVSGDMDPVGGFGEGVGRVYDGLLKNGVTDLTVKLYPGARHELFNETNREEVFGDILSWVEGAIG